MKQVTIKLELGLGSVVRTIPVSTALTTAESIVAYAKRKYTSVIHMGGKVSLA